MYSHAINNLDVQKVLLNNTNTLRVLTIYNRHFDLDKAFKNIKLPLLTQFSFIDYPREISDVAIAQFTKSCPNLTLINFSGCSKLKDHTFTLLVISLKKISDIIILRNNLISSEFLQSLTGTNLNIRRIELGGNPHEFQTKLKLEGGIEHFCEYFKFKLQVIRLEYCTMIGEEACGIGAADHGQALFGLVLLNDLGRGQLDRVRRVHFLADVRASGFVWPCFADRRRFDAVAANHRKRLAADNDAP